MTKRLSNHKINCVLFDLDQTLVEIPDAWHYFDQLIIDVMDKDLHLSVPTSAERDTLWRTGKDYIVILKQWGVKDPNFFWYLFDKRDGEKRVQYIRENKLHVYPEVINVLQQLYERKIKLGLITNTPTFIAEMELTALNLRKFFQLVLGMGENQEKCKPEPDGILCAIQKLETKAIQTLYIGDSLVDLIAAKRAKVIPVFLDRTKSKKLENSEVTETDIIRIGDISEIFALL